MTWLKMPAIQETDTQRAYLSMAEEPAIDRADGQGAYLGMAEDAGHR